MRDQTKLYSFIFSLIIFLFIYLAGKADSSVIIIGNNDICGAPFAFTDVDGTLFYFTCETDGTGLWKLYGIEAAPVFVKKNLG